MRNNSFLSNQWIGIISILIASIFAGLWYNTSYKLSILETQLNNPFLGSLNRAVYQDYKFYANLYLLAGVLLIALGLYIIRNYYLQSKVK